MEKVVIPIISENYILYMHMHCFNKAAPDQK